MHAAQRHLARHAARADVPQGVVALVGAKVVTMAAMPAASSRTASS
jgi:hypothetical protein